MGVKITGHVTAQAYAKKGLHFCNSGPVILGKINSSPKDYARPASGHSRVTPKRPGNRRQYSILSYLRRWITNIWYGIMRRVKNMFNAQVNPDTARSNSTRKIPSEMDSELENAFWREGTLRSDKIRGSLVLSHSTGRRDRRYCGLGDHADGYSLDTVHPPPKTLSGGVSDPKMHRKPQAHHSPGLKKRGNQPQRIDSPLSSDEEYNALYESKPSQRHSSGPDRPSGKGTKNCGYSIDGNVSGTKTKREKRGGSLIPEMGNYERCSKELSVLKTNCKSPSDGERVWYTGSELNIAAVPDRQKASLRTRPSSRIPRLCTQKKKSTLKHH